MRCGPTGEPGVGISGEDCWIWTAAVRETDGNRWVDFSEGLEVPERPLLGLHRRDVPVEHLGIRPAGHRLGVLPRYALPHSIGREGAAEDMHRVLDGQPRPLVEAVQVPAPCCGNPAGSRAGRPTGIPENRSAGSDTSAPDAELPAWRGPGAPAAPSRV